MNIVPTTASLQGQNLSSQEIAEEIKAVASAALQLNKIELKEIEDFERNERIGPKLYTGAIKSALEACFSDWIKLQVLVERMLSSDPQSLPNLEELRIKDIGSQAPANPIIEQSSVSVVCADGASTESVQNCQRRVGENSFFGKSDIQQSTLKPVAQKC